MNSPSDIQAEEAVLGSLLIDSESIYEIDLRPQDFFREKNQWVFQACADLINDRVAIDQVTVTHKLADSGRLEGVGGGAYLSYLIGQTATSIHIAHYAEIVKQKRIQRDLLSKIPQIEALATNGSKNCVADSIGLLMGIEDEKTLVMSPRDMAELAAIRYSELQKYPKGIWFHLGFLDDLGMLSKGQTCVVAGVTGHGKTTLVQQIARFYKTLFVSCEMSSEDLLDREVARLTKRGVDQIARGMYCEDLETKIWESIGALAETSTYYYTRGAISVDSIYRQARRFHGELDLIVVDYVQLLEAPDGARTEYQAVTQNSRQLKTIARELDIPIIIVSQLSRDINKPLIYRLKESGSLENDADWVIVVSREKDEDTYTGDTINITNKIILCKRRQGGLPLVGRNIYPEWEVEFDKEAQEFKYGK